MRSARWFACIVVAGFLVGAGGPVAVAGADTGAVPDPCSLVTLAAFDSAFAVTGTTRASESVAANDGSRLCSITVPSVGTLAVFTKAAPAGASEAKALCASAKGATSTSDFARVKRLGDYACSYLQEIIVGQPAWPAVLAFTGTGSSKKAGVLVGVRLGATGAAASQDHSDAVLEVAKAVVKAAKSS